MATLLPGVNYQPLAPVQGQAKMRAHDIICIHTMVGSLWGTNSYFKNGGWDGVESHFGTGYDGEIIQWQDTDYVAEANMNGNWHIISIENADFGTGFPAWNTQDPRQVPAFTPAQIEANAKIIAWACQRYSIPCVLIPDSKVGRRGIGYHRQGVDPYRDPGGEVWSSPGRACPGDRRVAQIPQIIERARQIMGVTPPIPTQKKEAMFQNHLLGGTGAMRVNIPVGAVSAVLARAFVSASSNGPDPAYVRVFAQSDTAGIEDWEWWVNFNKTTNISERKWRELKSGTTQLVIQYKFPQGGCITLEGVAK